MSLQVRPYKDFRDFIVMTSILAVGRKTSRRPYYVHTGDLSWWMFYDDRHDSHWGDQVHLWNLNGHPCGWSLIDPDWKSFDVYLLPELRGSREEAAILDWTIQKVTEIVRQQGDQQIRTMWVSENDEDRRRELAQRGFVQEQTFMWYLEHPLNAQIPELVVPADFVIRSLRGEDDLRQRAAASYDAFGSSKQFEEYWPRYQCFMRSPVYNPNYDLVAEAPDGQFASFCVIWPDPINRIGLFEPVGTHSSYQHQGLGRAVVTEGLRQLKTFGMKSAMVCTENNNPAALQLYQAVGFKIKQKLLTYTKTI
jgi:mycothiol synthase